MEAGSRPVLETAREVAAAKAAAQREFRDATVAEIEEAVGAAIKERPDTRELLLQRVRQILSAAKNGM